MGAVNISNTGSGAAVTLSSNGSALLLNGTAIGGGSSTITISNKTGAYTVVAGDLATVINCTGATSFTVSLTAAATLGAGFNVTIWNTGTGVITIDPNGAETLDGVSTIVLQLGEGVQIICDGTNFQTGNKKTMRGYAENIQSIATRPVVTGTNSIALGITSTASGVASIALGTESTASGSSSLAVGRAATASGNSATAIGRDSNGNGAQAVTGAGAMALGGSYASGTDSFAAAVANNTGSYGATRANSVAIGQLSRANGIQGVAIGDTARAMATNTIALGSNANATGSGSVVIAGGGTGWGATATVNSAFALGDGAASNIYGKFAFASGSSNVGAGIFQSGLFILSITTTGATPTTLNSYNYGTSDSTNQVILPNNSAFAFTGTVVARQQAAGGTASAAWKVEGLIRREANAGTTTLVASVVTPISNIPLWALALTADTTNGGLAITATGAASTNIRWVATIQTSEVTYA